MLRKTIICCAMIGIVALAWASSGGGKKKTSTSTITKGFTPIRTINGFTLKAGPQYMGSRTAYQHSNGSIYNTLVTYQKGNTIYILPYRYKSNIKPGLKNNFNVLDLKIRLHK
ncbi:MAG TPA: hypothetical protein VM012_08215 [Flavitalea sp.]|nr:hypothetical protein [Flavitalea sp.]